MTEVLTARSIGGLPIQKAGKLSPYLNMGIYGESGIGKTLLGGSASAVEGMYPVLDIDLEDGSETLRRTYPNVDVVRAVNVKEMQAIYDELYLSKTHGYKTVLLDSTSELDVYVMNEVMAEKLAKDSDAEDVPEWPEHRKKLIRMNAMIRGFRDLPMHTIFTSLSQSYQDKKTGETTILPLHSGAFKDNYPALLDVVLYYYAKEIKDEEGMPHNLRFLLSQKTEKAVAKDRTQTLPITMENPTMQKIYDLMWDKAEGGVRLVTPKDAEVDVTTVTETENSNNLQIDI